MKKRKADKRAKAVPNLDEAIKAWHESGISKSKAQANANASPSSEEFTYSLEIINVRLD